LNLAFKFEIEFGLIEILVPPVEFYPDFKLIKNDKIFNDSIDRVKWRTKQNLDYSYLMSFCSKRGKYYLQLEDDIVAKPSYFSLIKNYVNDNLNKDWMMIEFTRIGFIGKLFKTDELPIFVNFFMMFAWDKPIDWLFDTVFEVKMCNPEKAQV
jgi:alpha-1,3-mannosylglycoprotein beta-1,4-N-acetylglucosaminyltransferase A/B